MVVARLAGAESRPFHHLAQEITRDEAMNFTFITRCYTTERLDRIKQNVADTFRDTEHTYRHCIIADLTHGTPLDSFIRFNDYRTFVTYVKEKDRSDPQCSVGMDKTLAPLVPVGDMDYVFVLDDDNLLHPDFLSVCDACHGEDAIIFKIEGRPELGNPSILNMYAVGHIDWANYITKLEIMQRIKIYHLDGPLRCSDGVFFEHMKNEHCTFKFIDSVNAWYNRLR